MTNETLLWASDATDKEISDHVKQFPKKKHVLRLITKTNHAFDFTVPDDFSMAVLMHSIRGAGYMMNPLCYFPLDNIAMIFLYEVNKPPGGDQSNVVQFPELIR